MIRKFSALLATVLFAQLSLTAQNGEFLHWVDPFIGTGGHGHTYPGAVAPFGMVQLSPDTRSEGWDGCSGYHRSDSTILGFSHTHLSGTGVPDYADLLVRPLPDPAAEVRPMRFDDEKARPGLYEVRLDGSVAAQLTATSRTGLHRYSFEQAAPGQKVGIRLDLQYRDLLLSHALEQTGEREVTGHRVSRAWAKEQHFYFVVRFSEPIRAMTAPDGATAIAHLWFDLPKNKTIELRVGVSGTSVEQARKNLDAEAPDELNFEQIRSATESLWDRQLGQIVVAGGQEADIVKFYTALYHCFVVPNVWSDADGTYRGMDGSIHRAEGYDHYTVFSLWDTYRTWHPLMTILDPERTEHFVRTFLAQFDQQGRLPVWELAGNETDCMIGYHSVSVIADAYLKGIRGFDAEKALSAMVATASRDARGLKDFRELGFLRGEKERESVSQTLEYAYDDWCIAQMAAAMGKNDVCTEFRRRARGWINLLDPRTGLFRPRMNGGFVDNFDPREVNFHFTEANAWQYGFSAPQEFSLWSRWTRPERLLDSLFSQNSRTTGRDQADITGLIGQYAHGNEPSHHIAYLYNLVGQPWKTRGLVHTILDSLYTDRPDGLSGNEDCGQMSAWFVMSAMGLYPLVPGSPYYALTAPFFSDITLQMPNGRNLRITAPCTDPSCGHVREVRLNGRKLDRMFVTHEEIVAGGTLEFLFGPEPVSFGSVAWPSEPTLCSASFLNDVEPLLVPVPSIEGNKTFRGETEVSILHLFPTAEIRYTTDGSVPTAKSKRYVRPFFLKKNASVKAVALYKGPRGWQSGQIAEAEFRRVEQSRAMRYEKGRYANQYDGGGGLCLLDGTRGPVDFRAGSWQGFEGEDISLVLDLGEAKNIRCAGLGCLEDQNAWIFFPEKVRFEHSLDGVAYQPFGADADHAAVATDDPLIKDFSAACPPVKVRYLRAVVTAQKKCPAWHKGAGGNAWLFVDEFWAE